MNPLAFVRFEVDQVVVPTRLEVIAPFASNVDVGMPWDRAPIAIVKGYTADGLMAVGEADRTVSREQVNHTLKALLHRNLLGLHPTTYWHDGKPDQPLPEMYPDSPLTKLAGYAQTLVETLWLDAVGKAAGLSAHALLGGRFRDRVRVDAWANRPESKGLAHLIEKAKSSGYKGMKLKCDKDGDTIHALAEIASSVPFGFDFTVDPMCAWRSFHESSRLFDKVAGLPFLVRIEDPFPHNAPVEWQRIRQTSQVPLIFHARSQDLLRFAIREQMADGYNVAGQPAFGFSAAAGMIAATPAHCWHGASLELGIIQLARLHACAAAPACEMASDLSSPWVREHVLLAEFPKVSDGTISVPNLPGLGAELDEAAIAHYRVANWRVE